MNILYVRLPLFLVLMTWSMFSLRAQLVINELSPSNDQVIEDEFGDSSDWIELYNTSEEAVSLGGYYLSDDPTEPQKWAFPNQNLAAGAWVLIFASDRDLVGTNLHSNFKLSAGGETVVLSDAAGNILDQIIYPPLATDQSLGRLQDGGQELALFSTPTPGYSNDNDTGAGFSAKPTWETEGHFFDAPTRVQLSHPDPTAQLFFTRDGSWPGPEDELYSGDIQLDTTTAIRVVAISPDLLPSAVVNRTFFVASPHVLPIVSIIGEPGSFWSWENGILVDGGPNASEEWPFWGANYWADIEVPIHFEFFSPEQELRFAERADTKVHGGRGARTNPLKPLRILFKKKYGSNTVEYPFFPDRERTTYKRLVLRNASGDYNNGHFRDAFLARYFIKEGLNLDLLAHRPVVVYVNGAYYGIENLREKSDQYYIQHNYGIDPDHLDLLEEDTSVVTGDFVAFDSMLQYVLTHDMREAEYFEQAEYFFDVENIAEGLIVQSSLNNGDWLHNNTKYWRERREGARWRYLIFDMDVAMGRHGWSLAKQNNLDSLLTPLAGHNKHADLFIALLENERYRHYFINRYADLFNTIFRPDIFRKEVDRTVAELEPEMPIHFGRWTWPGYDTWINSRVEDVYTYLEDRPDYAREDIRDYFGLTGEVELDLQTYPAGAGQIKVNTIQPEELPWSGVYFKGVPVQLTIEPNAGFNFSHWQSKNTITSPDASTSIRYDFQEDDRIIAYFKEAPIVPQLEAYLPASGEQAIVKLGLVRAVTMSFSLYDVSGRLLRSYSPEAFGAGEQEFKLSLPALTAGLYLLQATPSEGEPLTAKLMKI